MRIIGGGGVRVSSIDESMGVGISLANQIAFVRFAEVLLLQKN